MRTPGKAGITTIIAAAVVLLVGGTLVPNLAEAVNGAAALERQAITEVTADAGREGPPKVTS
jgi:hypothetical protein